ncbi:hypothetical protein O181_081868 [Austropuccinia psidii MF-1]|uniref:Uncharacterized protein n=1 Tax=Austropuccinia psidii MF-1 TaxID=1389203 RepID=A0A9Q3IHX6_9BASI|nr:hypothetical protein [Austropuccinia psidii MF-1]
MQDYASLPKINKYLKYHNPSDMISSTEEPDRIVYYFRNVKHDNKCISHKWEESWAANPHLRPANNAKKQKFKASSSHKRVTGTLMTLAE